MKTSLGIILSCVIGCYIVFFLTPDPLLPSDLPLTWLEEGFCRVGILMMAPALPFAFLFPFQPAILSFSLGTALASVFWPFMSRMLILLYHKNRPHPSSESC